MNFNSLIEKPLRFGKNSNVKSLILLIFMVILVSVGYNCYKKDGYVHRQFSDVSTFNINAFEWPKEKMKSQACDDRLKIDDMDFCLMSADKEPTVALIGDSHANAIYDAVNFDVMRKGGGLIMFGKGGCPPFLGVERDNKRCPEIMEQIVSYITANNNIKDVIITGRFAATLTGINFGGETPDGFYKLKLTTNPNIKDREKIFEIGLENIIKVLLKSKKKITIVLDYPEIDFDPKSCLHDNNKCSIKYDIVAERQKKYTEIINTLHKKYDFKIIDLKSAFYRQNVYIAKFDNHILYRDQQHLGINGSSFLINSGFEFLK